ncbi:MAG: hypothetical protein ACT4RN_14365 [Pseudonocardia sp.]
MRITTLRTLTGDCPNERVCPSIHVLDVHPARRYVITKKEVDPAIAAAFAHLVGDDEQIGWVPDQLIPEINP